MLISTKGRYALRVMIELAEHKSEEYVPTQSYCRQARDLYKILGEYYSYAF